jgi:hypothetical protein
MYMEFCSINLKVRYHLGMTGTVRRIALRCAVEKDGVKTLILSQEPNGGRF